MQVVLKCAYGIVNQMYLIVEIYSYNIIFHEDVMILMKMFIFHTQNVILKTSYEKHIHNAILIQSKVEQQLPLFDLLCIIVYQMLCLLHAHLHTHTHTLTYTRL